MDELPRIFGLIPRSLQNLEEAAALISSLPLIIQDNSLIMPQVQLFNTLPLFLLLSYSRVSSLQSFSLPGLPLLEFMSGDARHEHRRT